MTSEAIAVEGKIVKEVGFPAKLFVVSDLVFHPFGTLVVRDERYRFPLTPRKLRFFLFPGIKRRRSLAFIYLCHHGNDVLGDGGDGTIEFSSVFANNRFVVDVGKIHEVLTDGNLALRKIYPFDAEPSRSGIGLNNLLLCVKRMLKTLSFK